MTGKIIAPYDGVVERKHLFSYGRGIRSSRSIKEGELFYIFYTEEEYVESHDTSYSIREDEITGEKRICWNRINGDSYYSSTSYDSNGCYFILMDYKALISLNIISGWPVLVIRCRKDLCKLRKKDTIHFVFEDKNVLSFTITETAKTSDFWLEVSFKLSREDIEVMRSKPFLKVRINSTKEISSVEIANRIKRLTDAIAQNSFKQFVREYEVALAECGFSWPESTKNQSSNTEEQIGLDEPCYVYLMVDTTNGFHKIGISNNPEYREHTLQSEKPTIELLAAKAFPSRRIAEAIESALHKAFGENRLRGEWFKLSDRDVSDIILTLK